MDKITLVFPNQLFENSEALSIERPVYLAEEFLYFKVQPFHKQRLVLLRASMKSYKEFLENQGFTVFYIDSSLLNKRGDLFTLLKKKGIKEIHLSEFTDYWLTQDLEKATKEYSWKIKLYKSPMFLCTEKELRTFFKGKTRYSMAQFYSYQRKKLNILMENGSPIGGKFSCDTENRKRLPKKQVIPPLPIPEYSPQVEEAISYVEKNFPKAIGEVSPFLYATTFEEAQKTLSNFIQKRLFLFGDYEDAIAKNESFLFHSVLSPLLNIGLLTPSLVVEKALSSYKKLEIPLNSIEGFIRQIIGWREFMRACYLLEGKKERTTNAFHHKNRLPKGFHDGTTGIEIIDTTIKKVLKTGYCHHIERLMVFGNFLLLTETDPDIVYSFFMGYFVDAYDWVMVPNVYAMSQYADNGHVTTKPYVSSSNYILKMSDYKKDHWNDLWDGLFWRFLTKHRPLFEKNPRTKVVTNLLDKNPESITPKIALAEEWLEKNTKRF
jgi:deoxyribodipyrimidine photolyase-related protein